jgi:hypothetical protein
MRVIAAMLVSVGCGFALAQPALGAVPIPAKVLALAPGDLPGFAGATLSRDVTRSAAWFAGSGEQAETAALKREGFREGVSEILSAGPAGGALSTAAVFRTARGAKGQLRFAISKERREQHRGASFTLPTIPGSFGVREMSAAPDGTGQLLATGVLFATGHCFVEIATFFQSTAPSSTPERVHLAAIAGAEAIYRRAKRACM